MQVKVSIEVQYRAEKNGDQTKDIWKMTRTKQGTCEYRGKKEGKERPGKVDVLKKKKREI